MFDKLKAKWAALDKRTKKYAIIGGIVLAVIALSVFSR